MHFEHRRKLCCNGTHCVLVRVVALSPSHRKQGTLLHRHESTTLLSADFRSDFSVLMLRLSHVGDIKTLPKARLSTAPFSI